MHRILYLSRGGSVGGSQIQLHHVIDNLDRDQFQPIVICRKDGQSTQQLRKAGIPTHVMPMRPWRSYPAAMLRYFDAWRIAEFARTQQISLVHSSDLWLSGYLRFVAKHISAPSVLHVRTPLSTECVHKHECEKTDGLIAISRRVKNNLLAAGIRYDRITVINDSVDIDAFEPSKSKLKTLQNQYPHAKGLSVGIVGRIDSFKRQLDFLKAARHILSEHKKQVTFFIIGNVHSESYYEKVMTFIKQNNLQQHVILTGPRNDMPQVIGSLDILVSLSGGSVMFEAMAAAKPVLSAGFSTKENSVHIQDGRTGMLITSKDNDLLVRGMLRLIDSPDLRRHLGTEAHKWAQDNFSHLSMTIKTQLLYEKVIARYGEQSQPVTTPIPQPGAVT